MIDIFRKGSKLTERNKTVRMCIANALIKLMEHKNIDEIKITELVKAANVSRMTFYKYYSEKEDVIEDYMYTVVGEYMTDVLRKPDIGDFHDYKRILHCFNYFANKSDFFKIIIKSKMQYMVQQAVNDYMERFVLPESKYKKYELYLYSGAISNAYLKWIDENKKIPVEELAEMTYNIFGK